MRNVNYLFFCKKNVLEQILLSCFLFFTLNAQTDKSFVSKSVLDYANYFERNRSNLDPIEGIWEEYAVGTLYEDTKVLSRLEERKRATWIVIKKHKRILLPNKNIINSNEASLEIQALFYSTFHLKRSVTLVNVKNTLCTLCETQKITYKSVSQHQLIPNTTTTSRIVSQLYI